MGVSVGDLDCEGEGEVDLERVGDTEPQTEDVIEGVPDGDIVELVH